MKDSLESYSLKIRLQNNKADNRQLTTDETMKYCPICDTKYDDSMSFCTRDGEVLQEDPTSFVGSTLDGQYMIEAMLGKGGMGAVYRARHILLGDRVAIKVLPPQMRNNAEWLRRFQREGQAARRFRHPNAVTVYDLRTTPNGLVYMVMEYVEGRTLDQELRLRTRFSPRDAFAVLEPVMSALNAAHLMGVVHRDLKPENIMIGREQNSGDITVKILDLGIAKLVAGDEATGTGALTVAGQILGTPFYMSPEQWGEIPRDGQSTIDGRADIYSLAAVFYELISGKRAFSGMTLPEVRREHVSITPKPLNEIVADVAPEFNHAVMRALSKDRNDRQGTMEQLAKELRAGLGLSPKETFASFLPIIAYTESHPAQTPFQQTNQNMSPATNAPTEVLSGNASTQSGRLQENTLNDRAFTQGHQPQNVLPVSAVVTSPAPINAGNVQPVQPHLVNVTVQPPPTIQPQSEQYAVQKKSKGKFLLILPVLGLGFFLVLAVVGIAGYVFWDKIFPPKSTVENTDNPPINTNGDKPDTPDKPITREAMRFWIDVSEPKSSHTERVAEEKTEMKSGQSFRFHFIPQDDGYLYIVGTGRDNVPTPFLTNVPIPNSGVSTNRVTKGIEYSFPDGGVFITLDNKVGLEKYTVIFSSTKLESPDFFSKEAGRVLSDGERLVFSNFVADLNANPTKMSVTGTDTKEPYVSVRASVEKEKPLIFVMLVDHK